MSRPHGSYPGRSETRSVSLPIEAATQVEDLAIKESRNYSNMAGVLVLEALRARGLLPEAPAT